MEMCLILLLVKEKWGKKGMQGKKELKLSKFERKHS